MPKSESPADRATSAARVAGQLVVDRAWLAQTTEDTYLPDQAIVDPHIHLWLTDPLTYTCEDYFADARGHLVEATVYAQCYTEYLTAGPEHIRPAGEVAWARRQAGAARSIDPSVAFCDAIIGFVELGPPEQVREAVDAQVVAGDGHLRALRPELYSIDEATSSTLLGDERWDRWAAVLQHRGLLLEAWVSYLQLHDLARLAQRIPELGIVVNHVGGAFGAASSDGASAMRASWIGGLRALAGCPNVTVKLGGLGTSVFGFRYFAAAAPPGSDELAAAWRPWIEPVIDAFGPSRCMFESNYPVDARIANLGILWNCFKRLAGACSVAELDELCRGTAARTYRLEQPQR